MSLKVRNPNEYTTNAFKTATITGTANLIDIEIKKATIIIMAIALGFMILNQVFG